MRPPQTNPTIIVGISIYMIRLFVEMSIDFRVFVPHFTQNISFLVAPLIAVYVAGYALATCLIALRLHTRVEAAGELAVAICRAVLIHPVGAVVVEMVPAAIDAPLVFCRTIVYAVAKNFYTAVAIVAAFTLFIPRRVDAVDGILKALV